jgi:hypothetical protein
MSEEFNFNRCGHKCHDERGLNPWVRVCVVCGCTNAKYNPNIPPPDSMGELMEWDNPDPALRPEKYRIPDVDSYAAIRAKEVSECSSGTI